MARKFMRAFYITFLGGLGSFCGWNLGGEIGSFCSMTSNDE